MHCCPAPSILAIDDDPTLGAHLKHSLEAGGFRVTLVDEGAGGLALAGERAFDLILLDVLLPGLNGLDVLGRLRACSRTPVIMMSALSDEPDRIRGFDCGADDYLPKPFSIAELRVRIEALLRRVAYERAGPQPVPEGELTFDALRSDVRHGAHWLGLTGTEYRLLELLYRHAGELQSKPFLYQQVLNRGFSQHDRSLDMHVSNIRRKLARLHDCTLRLESVWGKGYVLRLREG